MADSLVGSIFSQWHYNDVIMGTIASQITSLTIVYSAVYSDADQRKHQSSASLAFVRENPRGPVNSPHKWPVTRKCFHLMTSSWMSSCCLVTAFWKSAVTVYPPWHLGYKYKLPTGEACPYISRNDLCTLSKFIDSVWHRYKFVYGVKFCSAVTNYDLHTFSGVTVKFMGTGWL